MSEAPKKLNIVHLSVDEKFIDMGLEAFERVSPRSNKLLVYTSNNNIGIKYKNTIKISFYGLLSGSSIKQIRNADLVVMHSLLPIFLPLVLFKKRKVPLLWIGWGRDYYGCLVEDFPNLLLPLTAKIRPHVTSGSITKQVKSKLFKLLKTILLGKITHFAPVLSQEYKRKLCRYTYIDWNYGTVEKNFSPESHLQITGRNILLGNSSTEENNHLDALSLLSENNVERNIIMPMSYGEEKYRDNVKEYIDREYKNLNVRVLEKFMEYKVYTEILSECDTVLMNHVRQQALGNIIFCIYMGMKVFIREECPTYSFLKESGIKIFSMNKLENNIDLLDGNLCEFEINNNRENIIKVWGSQEIDRKTRELIECLCY